MNSVETKNKKHTSCFLRNVLVKKSLSSILLVFVANLLHGQEFAILNNPSVSDLCSYSARLVQLQSANIGFEINNRFIKTLNVLSFSGALPISSAVCFGMYGTHGFSSYREHVFSMGISKRITPRWAFGLQAIPKIETFGKTYQSKFSMNLDATCFAKIGQYLFWDSEFNIPIRTSSNTKTDAPLQSFLRMGLSYVFSTQCQTMVRVKQMLQFKTEVDLQFYYSPIPSLVFLGSVGSSSDFGFGMQYVFEQTTCRFQTQYRPVIGYSTTIGVSFSFKTLQIPTQHDF